MGVRSKFWKIALGAIFTGLPLRLPAAAPSIRSFSGRTGFDNLLHIADFYDVSVDWLMGRTDNPHAHR